jgi:hypothetical protein
MTDIDTNPVADDDARPDAGVDEEARHPNELGPAPDEEPAEAADEPDPDEAAEDDDEFDLDGERLRLPKKVAPYLMRQADYTRKTQELAEQRRAFEQSRASAAQVEADEIMLVARVQILQEQVRAFDEVDWDALEAESPHDAQRLWRQREQLKDAVQKAGGDLHQAQQSRAEWRQHAFLSAVQEREAVLADPRRGIKGWGPELGDKLTDYAHSEFGVSPQELTAQTDPRSIKVLHRAYSLEQEVKSLRKRLGLQQQQEIRPAPRPGGSAGAGALSLSKAANGDFAQFEAILKKRGAKG